MAKLTSVRAGALAAVAVLWAACSAPDDAPFAQTAPASSGALVRMQMRSTVGLLLDEIPAGRLRERAAAQALEQDRSYWSDRALRQTRLTYYRPEASPHLRS